MPGKIREAKCVNPTLHFLKVSAQKNLFSLTRPSRKKCLGKFTPGKNYSLYCISRPRVAAQSNRIFRMPYNLFAAFPGHEQIEWRAEDGDHREPSQSTFVCLWRDMWRIGSSKTITTSFRRMYLTMTSRIIAVRSTQSRRRRHRRSKTTWKDRTPGGPCLPPRKSHRKEKEPRRKTVEPPRCPPRNRLS